MTKEQLLEMAEKALKDWAENGGTPGGCAAGYNVLRYAKQGLYKVVNM